MTIGKRLTVLLAVPLITLFVFGIVLRIQLSTIEERSRFVAESQLAAVAALGNISGSLAEIRVSLRDVFLAADQTQRAAARAQFDENERTLTRLLQRQGDSIVSSERDRRLFENFQALSQRYVAEAKQAMAMVEEGRRDEALAHFR